MIMIIMCHLVSGDDSPESSISQHICITKTRAGRGFILDNFILKQRLKHCKLILYWPEQDIDTSCQSSWGGEHTCVVERLDHQHQALSSACPPSWWSSWAETSRWCSTPASHSNHSESVHLSPDTSNLIWRQVPHSYDLPSKSISTLNVSVSWSSVSWRRWMVKLPHWVLLAWNLSPSTCRYLVLTVWDLSLLNRATLLPEAMHTTNISFNVDFNVDHKLTIRVLDALFLLRWFWYHFYTLWYKGSSLKTIGMKEFGSESEVFPLVCIWDEESLGCRILFIVDVQLLHVSIIVSNTNKTTQLRAWTWTTPFRYIELKIRFLSPDSVSPRLSNSAFFWFQPDPVLKRIM